MSLSPFDHTAGGNHIVLSTLLPLLPPFYAVRQLFIHNTSIGNMPQNHLPRFVEQSGGLFELLAPLHPHSGIVPEYSLARLEPDFRLDRSADFVCFILPERRRAQL
ncbi:hypothetical protein [Geobacillus jurassicus]|nr:hypothetical protein [Geobacillus jurassicus]